MLVRLTYGTGLRWGEISALAAKHVRSPQPGKFEVRVTRAWKRDAGEPWFLGPPKTKEGRRTVEITAGPWQELQAFGPGTLGKEALLFHDGTGAGRLPYSTFYDRWMGAVAEAKRRGVMPEWKVPTFHDIRHSHVAALLSDNHSLTCVQRRLGHESIKWSVGPALYEADGTERVRQPEDHEPRQRWVWEWELADVDGRPAYRLDLAKAAALPLG